MEKALRFWIFGIVFTVVVSYIMTVIFGAPLYVSEWTSEQNSEYYLTCAACVAGLIIGYYRDKNRDF